MRLTKRATGRRGLGAGVLAAALASGVLVLAVATMAGCGSSTTAETQPEATQTTSAGSAGGGGALDFSGKTLGGADVSLSGYRGKPLVLAFMASW